MRIAHVMTKNFRCRILRIALGFVCVVVSVVSGWPVVSRVTMAANEPVLLTQANSMRAVALESVTFMREPFSVTSDSPFYGSDRRTRIALFARNLTLQPDEEPSVVRATAEDKAHRQYVLDVEHVGSVPGQEWVSQVILRLSNDLSNDTGDVLVQISYHGLLSNRVRVGIGHVGDGPFVLEFDGAPKAVDYGNFWTYGIDLGHFFWEFWAMPGTNADVRYLVSDGYGGNHALLLGMGYSDERGRYPLAGNVWNGVANTSFTSDDGPAPGEWGHIAVGWDGTNIITYFDGVPVGEVAFVGPRREIGGSDGGGRLLIGGSDHQNFIGRISQVRGFENSNPHESVNGNGASMAAFAPQTIFETAGTLLSSFTRPTLLVADRSGNNYVGHVRSTVCGIPYDCTNDPLPQFVIDSTAPSARPFQPATLVAYPANVPAGARVFDSFSRPNSTYAFDNVGGLDMTEGGTAGRHPWQYSQAENGLLPFGILNGRAVVLANSPSAAWVSTGDGPADLDIRVDRRPGPSGGTGIATGLVFRSRDSGAFFYAYTTGDSAATQALTVGYVNGAATGLLIAGAPMPASWLTLRVVTLASGSIQVYADSTLLYSTITSVLATEKNAGLWNFRNGQGLSNRWDNFTVYDASP
jgi:concanavalin A-like lectin/glucanase superfamily protein